MQSIASSAKADPGGDARWRRWEPQIHSVDLTNLTTSKYTRLGVYENKVPLNTVMAAAPNGASILLASADGSVMLYDANVDTFTISRKDFNTLGGAYAASSYGQYAIGNMIFDSSLVQTSTIQPTTGTSSGFAFVGSERPLYLRPELGQSRRPVSREYRGRLCRVAHGRGGSAGARFEHGGVHPVAGDASQPE